jgi:membrane protease YdiL (CAAX protease family)
MPRIFRLARASRTSHLAREEISAMPDPTELVLTGAFATAVVVFAVTAGLRAWSLSRFATAATDGEISVIPPNTANGRVSVIPYQAIDILGASLVFLIFSGLVLASLNAPARTDAALNAESLLVNIGFQFLMAGLVTAIVIRRVRISSWLGLRWPAWRWQLLLAPASLLFMWILLSSLKIGGYVQWMESLGVETTQESVKLLQKSQDPLILGLMIIAAVVAAPLCEEIVFRGYLYPVLKKFSGILPATLCSSLVFAAAHGSLITFVPFLIFGGVLVFLYEKTGSIWAPIAAHFCFNAFTVTIQMAARYYEIPL